MRENGSQVRAGWDAWQAHTGGDDPRTKGISWHGERLARLLRPSTPVRDHPLRDELACLAVRVVGRRCWRVVGRRERRRGQRRRGPRRRGTSEEQWQTQTQTHPTHYNKGHTIHSCCSRESTELVPVNTVLRITPALCAIATVHVSWRGRLPPSYSAHMRCPARTTGSLWTLVAVLRSAPVASGCASIYTINNK